MPQASALFATGCIKALEGRLISNERLERMLEASDAQEAFRVLLDTGYGSQAGAQSPRDYEAMIDAELQYARELVQSITPAPEITDLFLMRYDYQNAKALFKMQLSGMQESAAISPMGILPADRLAAAVQDAAGTDIPEHLANAIRQVQDYLVLGKDPAQVDRILDRAYMRWVGREAKACRNAFVQDYFLTQLDLYNVLALLRMRGMGAEAEAYRRTLVDGGRISRQLLLELYASPPETVSMRLQTAGYGREMAAAVEQCLHSGTTWAFEKWMDNQLVQRVKRVRGDLFSIQPLIGWFLAKEGEARAVRLVMVGKLNRLSGDKLRERVRENYV